MDKKNLMKACESLKYDIIQKLTRFVRDSGEECTDSHRNDFGLDCEEYDGRRVTKVLNFYDNNGCYFFEPDCVNCDGLEGMDDENWDEKLYEHTVHTSYYCLYIVTDGDRESLHYYRDTNGGLTYDLDQADPDHGDCLTLNLVDLHYILQAINVNF